MAKGKKQQSLSAEELLEQALVHEDEQKNRVPSNWVWVRLWSILSEIKNGTTVKQDKEGIGAKVTRIESIQNNQIDNNRLGYIARLETIRESDWYIANDIAFSHINSAEHVGKTAIITDDLLPLVHGMNLLRLRLNLACVPKYLYYFSQSFQYKQSILERINMAVNQVSINQKQVGDIDFPLPPLAEQQRIVDRIENLFAKLDQAKELVQNALDSFEPRKAAILHKAFTGELTAKWREEHGVGMDSWKTMSLSKLAYIQTGLAKGKQINSVTTTMPYLRVANVQDGYLDLSEIKLITVEKDKIERYRLKEGDVLFTEGGDYDKLGRGTVWRAEIDNCLHQNHVFAVRPEPTILNSFYLAYLGSSRYGKNYFLSCSKQTTNLASINSTQLKAFPVLCPSIIEQQEIVSILDTLIEKEQSAKYKLEVLLDQIDLMKKSILSHAFRGELGTNDPSEGSAFELLKEVVLPQ